MYWWIIPLVFYIGINLIWVPIMIKDVSDGVHYANTPRELAHSFGCNLFGGIVLYIIDFLFFPLWNVLLLIYKFLYWIFHVGMDKSRVD